MKLQPDSSDVQSITGYGPGWISVDRDKLGHSVLLGSTGLRLDWDCSRFADLTAQHFDRLAQHVLAMGAEVVIFGSGGRLRFVSPAWQHRLMAQRVGMETMDTQAACRTYNILAGEGRKVLVALLLEQSDASFTPLGGSIAAGRPEAS
ncbi:MAG: hypothetical protein RLZZ401_537 [Pseudomonadota bacterium]